MKRVNEIALNHRKEYCKVDMENMSIPDLEDTCIEAKIEWENFKWGERESQSKTTRFVPNRN